MKWGLSGDMAKQILKEGTVIVILVKSIGVGMMPGNKSCVIEQKRP